VGDFALPIGYLLFFAGIINALIAVWIALAQGGKFFPLVIGSLVGIFYPTQEQII